MLTKCPRTARSRAGLALGLGGLVFVAMQLVLNVLVERHAIDWRDPEYGQRLRALQQARAAHPDRPLLLFLGSSRVGTGIVPECMPILEKSTGQQVLAFNFSHAGSGPALNALLLDRLLRQGIKPDWVVAEILPTNWHGRGDLQGEGWWTWEVLEAHDLPALAAWTSPAEAYGTFVRDRLAPIYTYRLHLFHALQERFGDAATHSWSSLGPLGRQPLNLWAETHDPEAYHRMIATHQKQFGGYAEHYEPGDSALRAQSYLQDRCQDEGIRLSYLIMPEASPWRTWFGPGAEATFQRKLAALTAGESMPVIDCRAWLADDCFSDSHHLIAPAADRFSQRLASTFLAEWLRGSVEPTAVGLSESSANPR